MLTTPHVLVGLYLTAHYNPWIAFPAVFLSHLLFDHFYPHWNPHLYTEIKRYGKLTFNTLNIIVSDLVVAGLFVLYFTYQALPDINQAILFIIGAVIAIMPDLIEIPYYFLKNRHPLLVKLVTFEHIHQAKASKTWGVSSQVFIVLICLWALLK